jgi:hypothetical protein
MTSTRTMTAPGVGSISGGSEASLMTLRSRVVSGLKSAEGRPVEMPLGAEDLTFILSYVAERYPAAIKRLAAELEATDQDYGPVPDGPYDRHGTPRGMRLRRAVHEALTNG